MTRLVLGPLLRHVGETDATVWVETDSPCTVGVLGRTERTWEVAGHHYALVVVDGLTRGTRTPYDVTLDGEVVWPPPDSDLPAPRIRTMDPDTAFRIVFGSCRYATPDAVEGDSHFAPDALDTYAQRMARLPDDRWPDEVLMLGDQVYADETSDSIRARIRERRDITVEPGEQIKDYEEYTWLYEESWTDPHVRWLLSTIPSSMIFDDHDVTDDWNTSKSWRAGHEEDVLVGGAHRRRAVVVLGLPAPRQPVAAGPRRA